MAKHLCSGPIFFKVMTLDVMPLVARECAVIIQITDVPSWHSAIVLATKRGQVVPPKLGVENIQASDAGSQITLWTSTNPLLHYMLNCTLIK